ncbi:complex I NDUFA9 subunit family protein [Pseudaestuariivita sp.]|uniref:complex I NDUFA9 subunit family protein n=1 Tax=Pseudaestuariivita sp. TaxID=2211669 RepID=UPI00405A2CF3
MSKLVTIYGGSGFVGRYIARRMAKAGWRVRVAVRRPNEAMFVKPYGAVGQVEPVFCNIRDDASVARVLQGADAVVNCVGTFDARGKNSFDNIHVEGAGRIARLAKAEGIGTMVHISAIGAEKNGPSGYADSKGRGEEAVLEHQPNAVILRPSVIFGPEDEFFNRFAGMARLSPALPVVGGGTRFQPVYVDNVAEAAAMGVMGTAAPGVYELGGPDVRSFTELMQEMLAVIHRRRLVLSLPFFVGKLMAFGFTALEVVTLGLAKNKMITFDQVKSLKVDNVVSDGAKTFADLGITPTATEAVLPDYLWRFRPSGQYDAIKDSARNLKT